MLIGYLFLFRNLKDVFTVISIIHHLPNQTAMHGVDGGKKRQQSNMHRSQARVHRHRPSSLMSAPGQNIFLEPSFVVRLPPRH